MTVVENTRSSLTVEPLPAEIRAMSAGLVRRRHEHDEFFTARANRELELASVASLGNGALLWRAVTNADRLHGRRDAFASLLEGHLVVSCFNHAAVVATTVGHGLRISSTPMMLTGLRFASHLLVTARIDDDAAPSVLLLGREAVASVVRPELRGLVETDNALVALDAEVASTAIVGARGAGRKIVEAPYDRGLTLGAVALGGLVRAAALVPDCPGNLAVRGRIVAESLAARSLVASCGRHRRGAGDLSRAAKVFATEAGVRAATALVGLAGPAAYGRSHPAAKLLADLEGLTFQAPTNRGSLERLGTADTPS